MRQFEESELTLKVVDRRVESLLATHDSTLNTSLIPFLKLVAEEPLLASCAGEWLERGARALLKLQGRCCQIARLAMELSSQCRHQVDWAGYAAPEFEHLAHRLQALASETDGIDVTALAEALDLAIAWTKLGESEAQRATLAAARTRFEQWRGALRRIELDRENFGLVDAGQALLRLQCAVPQYASTEELAIDGEWDDRIDKIRARRIEAERWGKANDESGQPYIMTLHRDIRIVHLALGEALLRGRSRWHTVRRFAAWCEGLDRERLVKEIRASEEAGRSRAEAILTHEFARYMHLMGFSPLIDPAVCGLRPDALDTTTERAIYVEAKQYVNVSDGIQSALKADLAQTLNTWMRLAKRWSVPEAFLLMFRRSGRPLLVEPSEVTFGGRTLFMLVVDLADPEESGSRAKEPVRVDLRELMARPRTGGEEQRPDER